MRRAFRLKSGNVYISTSYEQIYLPSGSVDTGDSNKLIFEYKRLAIIYVQQRKTSWRGHGIKFRFIRMNVHTYDLFFIMRALN
jgi:hypothetical protein